MAAVEVRAACRADADVVAEYHRRCFEQTYASQLRAGELEPPDLDGVRHQLREWFRDGSGMETRVATLDGTPVGHVTVSGHRLVHLFVDPAHQGTGLGRRLLMSGEAMITAGGHTRLELHARPENVEAIAFYEAAGWQVTDRMVRTVEHGIAYDERVLVKHRR